MLGLVLLMVLTWLGLTRQFHLPPFSSPCFSPAVYPFTTPILLPLICFTAPLLLRCVRTSGKAAESEPPLFNALAPPFGLFMSLLYHILHEAEMTWLLDSLIARVHFELGSGVELFPSGYFIPLEN
jgi:hypothetical protein